MKRGARAMVLLAMAGSAGAQEGQLGSDFRREGEAISKACDSFKFTAIGKCGYTLFTDHPMHIAAGSIAPGNGFGLGPAFVAHWTTDNWRLSWDVDGVVLTNGSWRAGGYMTAVVDHHGTIVAVAGKGKGNANLVREHPVIHVLAQAISLGRIAYFGLGPDTGAGARTYFGMKETVVGVNGTWPVVARWNVALFGEANGRFMEIRPSTGAPSPLTEQVFGPTTAPGLSRQPGFAQFGQGVRMAPALAGGHVLLDYAVTMREYVAGDSTFSFQRWTVEASHQFPIVLWSGGGKKSAGATAVGAWRGTPSKPAGPDDCGAGTAGCPAPTRNTGGASR